MAKRRGRIRQSRAVREARAEPKEAIELEEGRVHFGHHWPPSSWFARVAAPQAGSRMRRLAASLGQEATRDTRR